MNEMGKKILLSVIVAVISILSTYFVVTGLNQETPKEDTDYKIQIADLEKNIDQYKKDIEEYKTQITNYETDIEEKDTEISTLNSQISEYKDDIKDYKNDITSKNNEISTLENEIKDYKEDIKDLEDTINSSTDATKIKNLEEQVTTLTNKIETNETKIEELKSEVSTLESKKKELEISVSTLTSIVSKLESENKELKANVTELNNKITTYENTIKEKNNEITELEEKVSTLESDLRDYKDIAEAVAVGSAEEYNDAMRLKKTSIRFGASIDDDIDEYTIDYDLTIDSYGNTASILTPIIDNAHVVLRGSIINEAGIPGSIQLINETELINNAILEIKSGNVVGNIIVNDGAKFLHNYGYFSGEVTNKRGGYVELNMIGARVTNEGTLILDAAFHAYITHNNGTLIFRDDYETSNDYYVSEDVECIGRINWSGGTINLSELPDNGKLEITIDSEKSKDDLKLNTNTKLYDESGNDITSNDILTGKIYVNYKK